MPVHTPSAHFVALCTLPALLTQGCLAHHPPPAEPEPIVPRVDTPDAPPPEGAGRIAVDVAGERAKVARVVETVKPSQPYVFRGSASPYMAFSGSSVIGEQRRTELLCVTPCILDLRRGAHTLVFTSLRDESRTSSADVVVSAEPSAVRHALGRSRGFSGQYVGGLALALGGGGLTTMGLFATTIGLVAKPTQQEDASGRITQDDPKAFLGLGLVLLGIGLAMGTTGVILASSDRPVQQPGSTTQWSLPIGPTARATP